MITRILARRFALMGAMAVLGAVTFAPKASAQVSQPVPFNGSVPDVCTFGFTVTQGTIELSSPQTFITQTPALVTLSCTGAATLEVEAPMLTAGPMGVTQANFLLTWSHAEILNDTILTLVASGGGPQLIDGPTTFTDQPVSVFMSADYGAPLPGGNYTFEVNVTVTPN